MRIRESLQPKPRARVQPALRLHRAALVALALLVSAPLIAGAEAGAARQGPAGEVSVVLAPRHRALLRAEVASTVIAIEKEMGEAFEAGDALVRLDAKDFEVKAQEARAGLAQAKAHVAEAEHLASEQTEVRRAEAVLAAAQADLAATKTLYRQKQASQVQLENAKRDVAVARADVELARSAAKLALANARKELARAEGELYRAQEQVKACTVRAPFAGRVVKVHIHAHERTEVFAPLVEVVNERVLLAKFLLPSKLFRTVRKGQTLRFFVQETATEVAGTISHISAVLDPASMTFEVFAAIDNHDGALRVGMNARLHLSSLGKE